jgi:hypothetical protein
MVTGVKTSNITQTECVCERAMRKIFGPKRDDVTGGCRKLHND